MKERLHKRFIKSVPMATCGLALGLAALGNLLKAYFAAEGRVGVGDALRHACGIMSLIFLLAFALKLFFDHSHSREELKTPIPLSLLPASTMALMLLCGYAVEYLPASTSEIAVAVWHAAVIAQACMMVCFLKKYLLGGVKLSTVFPSWFIVFVGIVTASVTAPIMGYLYIGQAAFYVGLVLYFVCLPIVAIRLIKIPHKLFPEPARPTIAITTAPASLLIVGYFSSFGVMADQSPNKKFVYFLLIVAAIMYLFVLTMMIPLLIKRFYPSYSSFTFPLVISALAFRLGATFIAKFHLSLDWLIHVAEATQWIAVAFVIFATLHYIRFFIYCLRF